METVETVIYRARSVTPLVEREVARLKEESGLPVVVVCYQRGAMRSATDGVMTYGERDIRALPYPAKLRRTDWNTLTGHHDLPLLAYFREHRGIGPVYSIEDDVRYSGKWGDLFAQLRGSRADLLMPSLQAYQENPDWGWWGSIVSPNGDVDLKACAKGFGPFCRLSARLLEALDAAYGEGWGGHFEATWPTIALVRGLTVEDLGQGRHYWNTVGDWGLWPGSFVYRPCFHESGVSTFAHGRPLLWHPVKG